MSRRPSSTDREKDGAIAFVYGATSAIYISFAAGLQGIHVMVTSAVLAFWSERLFSSTPSLGFTAALLATAAGSVLGPAFAGIVSDSYGAAAMFLGTAALPALTAAVPRDRRVRERSAIAATAERP